MDNYLAHMRNLLDHGHAKEDRTGTGTLSLFGHQMRFKLLDGFPLLTTKKVHMKSVIYELLWFLQGATNKKWLNDRGVTIWDSWANKNGDLGPIYGSMWRSWPTQNGGKVDQLAQVIEALRTNPDDRRMIVSAWNVGDLPDMALPPCHLMFQFYSHEVSLWDRMTWKLRQEGHHANLKLEHVREIQEIMHSKHNHDIVNEHLDMAGIPRRGLSCQMYQRSCDWFLGVPFNIASYSLLTMMVAQVTGMIPYEFVWTGGDTHLYLNHRDQAGIQLQREPRELPWMRIDPAVEHIDSFDYDSFLLQNYFPDPHIKAPVAV